MRCYCCDKILTDYEATLRSASSDEFVDTCLKCLQGLNIVVKGNNRLKKQDYYNDEEYETDDPELQELIRQQRRDQEWDSDD